MQALEKRLSALEKTQPQGETPKFIFIVSLGREGEELTHIHDNHGNNWHRRSDETEREFKDRATSETPRKENQVVLMFGEYRRVVP